MAILDFSCSGHLIHVRATLIIKLTNRDEKKAMSGICCFLRETNAKMDKRPWTQKLSKLGVSTVQFSIYIDNVEFTEGLYNENSACFKTIIL